MVGAGRSSAARTFAAALKKHLARGQTVCWGPKHQVSVHADLARNDDGEVVRVQYTTTRGGRPIEVEVPRR